MKNKLFKFFYVPTVIIFIVNTACPVLGNAQTVFVETGLKPVSTVVPPSVALVLKGMTIDVKNPLRFEFIVDAADAASDDPESAMGAEGSSRSDSSLRSESTKLIHYFLASLTTPEDQLWVNLSPDEPDRILPKVLDQTQIGQDLIGQDYLLKRLTASLLQPENEIGKKFWEEVYEKIYQEQNSPQPPLYTKRGRAQHGGVIDQHDDLIQMINKVWIVPGVVKVAVRNHSVFITEAKLKVMAESEYLSLRGAAGDEAIPEIASQKTLAMTLKDIILPAIEKEINEGEQFAQLRQMYQAMILASWYKKNLKQSLLGQSYVNQQKTDGINTVNPQIKDQLYQKYLDLFRNGTNNLIREEYNPETQAITAKHYISGGYSAATLAVDEAQMAVTNLASLVKDTQTVTFQLNSQQTSEPKSNAAMLDDDDFDELETSLSKEHDVAEALSQWLAQNFGESYQIEEGDGFVRVEYAGPLRQKFDQEINNFVRVYSRYALSIEIDDEYIPSGGGMYGASGYSLDNYSAFKIGISDAAMMSEHLLTEWTEEFDQALPRFEHLTFKDISLMVKNLGGIIRKNIDEIERLKVPVFANTIVLMDRMLTALDGVLFLVDTLVILDEKSFSKTQEIRLRKILLVIRNRVLLNKTLYKLLEHFHEQGLDEEERALVKRLRTDARNRGIGLFQEDQKKIREAKLNIQILSKEFLKNSQDHFSGTYIVLKKSDLYRFGKSGIESFKKNKNLIPEDDGLPEDSPEKTYRFYPNTFNMKNLLLRNLDNENLRQELMEDKWQRIEKNKAVFESIRRSFRVIAQTLGFKNYADMIFSQRMFDHPDEVLAFLDYLERRYEDLFAKDLKELVEFKKVFLKTQDDVQIKERDAGYFEARQKEQIGSADDSEIRKYFPFEGVLRGLLDVYGELYGVELRENKEFESPHGLKHLQAFDSQTGELAGTIYLSPDARPEKTIQRAIIAIVEGQKTDEHERKPVIFLSLDFQPGMGLSPDQYRGLFHEFGHAFHSLFSRPKYGMLSGMNGFAVYYFDFFEFLAFFSEQLGWNRDILRRVAGYADDNGFHSIPEEYIDQIRASQSIGLARQKLFSIMMAKFDLAYAALSEHRDSDEVLNQMAAQGGASRTVYPMQTFVFQLVNEEYVAAAYNYSWGFFIAEMLAKYFGDLTHPEIWRRYRKEVLEKGASVNPKQMLRNLLGDDAADHSSENVRWLYHFLNDKAMLGDDSPARKGGIDLNAAQMNLQEDGAPMAFDPSTQLGELRSGQGMPEVDPAQLQNVTGFVPVILSIRPTDVKVLLGY